MVASINYPSLHPIHHSSILPSLVAASLGKELNIMNIYYIHIKLSLFDYVDSFPTTTSWRSWTPPQEFSSSIIFLVILASILPICLKINPAFTECPSRPDQVCRWFHKPQDNISKWPGDHHAPLQVVWFFSRAILSQLYPAFTECPNTGFMHLQ